MILDIVLSAADCIVILAIRSNGLSPMGRGYHIQAIISNLVAIVFYGWWFSSLKQYADKGAEK